MTTELLDPLAQHAAATPDRVALVDRSTTLTYAALNRRVNRVASALVALGARPGERLAWLGRNSAELVTLLHAMRKVGLVSVPISYYFRADEAHYIIDDSGARSVVVEQGYAPVIEEIKERLPGVRSVVSFDSDLDTSSSWDDFATTEAEPDVPVVGDGAAAIIYTSGTTGHPKGAIRRPGNDPRFNSTLLELLRFGTDDEVHMATAPIYHSGPQGFALVTHLRGGALVVTPRFAPAEWLRLVQERRVTSTFLAPTHLKRILAVGDEVLADADVSSLRTVIANAAPVPYSLKQAVIAVLGDGFLFEIYGSTELGVTTVLEPKDQLRKPGSCGRPFGPVATKVLRPDGSLADVGEPGLLFVSTPAAMQGYHGSRAALESFDGGAWQSVGDIAYLDDEGYVYICDRANDVIITGSMKVYPAEVEGILHGHPAVADAAVIGLPSDEWGETVHAIVEPSGDVEPDLDELGDYLRTRLANYKCPRTWEVISTLPRTDAGKLLKRELVRDRVPVDHQKGGA